MGRRLRGGCRGSIRLAPPPRYSDGKLTYQQRTQTGKVGVLDRPEGIAAEMDLAAAVAVDAVRVDDLREKETDGRADVRVGVGPDAANRVDGTMQTMFWSTCQSAMADLVLALRGYRCWFCRCLFMGREGFQKRAHRIGKLGAGAVGTVEQAGVWRWNPHWTEWSRLGHRIVPSDGESRIKQMYKSNDMLQVLFCSTG